MSESMIREPQPHDAKSVRELARLAHPKLPDSMIQKLGSIATSRQSDSTTATWTRTIDGTQMQVPFLHSMRIIAPPDRHARAMIFSAPPMDWIIAQGRDSGMSIEDRAALAGALAELQLLATAPRWSGRGYATQLLADLENRYRAAGYRAIFAVVEHDNDDALTWYRKRGFIVGDLNTWPMIQLWKNRMHQPARYSHINETQLIGFKALHESVSITELNGTVHVRGLLG